MTLIERLQAYFEAVAASQAESDTPLVVPLGREIAPAPTAGGPAPFIRAPLMACTPAGFRPAAPVPDAQALVLSNQSPIAAVQDNLNINARGFAPVAQPASEAEAIAFRSDLVTARAVTLLLDGQPVASGMITAPLSGISELAGLTTLAAYRGRGLGAVLTSELTRVAFAQGVDTAILYTENPAAARIYQRVGYVPVATLIRRRDPAR